MTASAAAVPTPEIVMIPLNQISPSPLNPRKHHDDVRLAELALSIRQKGIRSPLQVRPGKKAGTFELIAGERRWTAASNINLVDAPCIVTPVTDDELVELALTENGQREDLTPMDEARAYQAAMKAKPKHYTVAVVAGTVGKSESYVYRRLKLLELAQPLQEALDENRLSIAHAERLVKLTTDKQLQAAAFEKGKYKGGGVVWRFSPLFDHGKEPQPGLEDLRPLHELDEFIRMKTTFKPTDEGLKYLQPELAEQIEAAVDEHVADDLDTDDAEARAALVSITTDPMARMRMGLKANDPMPLTPSKWREVKPGKECEFTRPGVITHGSEARVLKVCIKKSCAKHWPVAKKKKAAPSGSKPAKPQVNYWEEQQRKEKLEREAFRQLLAEALPALAEFTKGVEFSAALVRIFIDKGALDQIEDQFGVKLTEATAAHVLLLSTISTSWRSHFVTSVKVAAPQFVPQLQRIEAAQKKAAAAQVKAEKKPEPVPTDAISRTVLHALNSVHGQRQRVKAAVDRDAKNKELDQLIRVSIGTGGYMDDEFDYRCENGQMHINKPVKRKLTVGKVRDVVRQLLGDAKKGKKR